jgi:raffinose/stachyose/melibiose transport system substrate-binding protein
MKKHHGVIILGLLAALLPVSFMACARKDGTGSGAGRAAFSFFNSKGEIQGALEDLALEYEKETGVPVEVLVTGVGESPYTKITSLYNSGTPPVLAMLDTTDIFALGESKAADLSGERWVEEVRDSLTYINGKVYSFPFCIEGRGIIFNQDLIEKTLGRPFDPAAINSRDALAALFQNLREAGMENPMVVSKEDWSLGEHQLVYIYEAYDGTSGGAETVIGGLKAGTFDLLNYPRYW